MSTSTTMALQVEGLFPCQPTPARNSAGATFEATRVRFVVIPDRRSASRWLESDEAAAWSPAVVVDDGVVWPAGPMPPAWFSAAVSAALASALVGGGQEAGR